ncbi:MAG: flagellar basal body protein, partial [Chloroflexota bacterium]
MDGITGDSSVIRLLERTLHGLARRQEAIGHNIANVDTPGFKALDVSFEDELLRTIARRNSLSLHTTNSRHIETVP